MSGSVTPSTRASVASTPLSTSGHRPTQTRRAAPQAVQESAFGYSTAPSIHREVKAALANRDLREHARGHGGMIVGARNPVANAPESAGFLAGHERFDVNGPRAMAESDRKAHESQQRKIASLSKNRQVRDETRWNTMDQHFQREQEVAAKIAGSGLRNRGSVGYNLINGSWGSSNAAATAKFHDDVVEYTAKMRTQNLDRRSNSNFNVITGEDRNVVRVPPKPLLPPL
jgi:hypothetical protein